MTDPDPNQGPSACFRRKTPDRVIRNREHYTLMSELRQRDDRQARRDRLAAVPDESPPSMRTQALRPRWAAPPSARPTTRSSGATTPRVMTTTSPSPERPSGSRPTRTTPSGTRSRPGPTPLERWSEGGRFPFSSFKLGATSAGTDQRTIAPSPADHATRFFVSSSFEGR